MRIKLYIVITFVLMMMLPIASADTLNVDDSGGQDYTTIQAAINTANDNDTILVYPGTYTENVDVNKSVSIISKSGNPDDTKVQAASASNHVFNVTRDNVTISGFNITNATGFKIAGIFLDKVQNNNISNNEIPYNYYGIHLKRSNNNIIISNNASNNDKNGIHFIRSSNNILNNNTALDNKNSNGILFEKSNNNTLNNNTAADNGLGIYLIGTSNNTLNNNTVTNNYYSIYVQKSSNNTLNNNTVSDNHEGILLEKSNNNTLNNNTASDNYYGFKIYDSSNNNTLNNNTAINNNDEGFYLHKFSDNNKLNDNTALKNDYGINLEDSSKNKMENNTVTNNYKGIRFFDSSNNNTLNNNIASNNYDQGIYIEESSNNSLNNNIASNNYDQGIYLKKSSHNKLNDNTANSSKDKNGITLIKSNNNTLNKNTAKSNEINGINLRFSSNNKLNSNVICNNNKRGIWLLDSDNNLIYNNYLNNKNNIEIDTSSTDNIWNTTNTSGQNIVDGSYLGGNYWAKPDSTGFSQTCIDANNDGFCDEEFNIDQNNIDYLPLVINASIDIEKYTNGEDADEPSGPAIQMGSQVTWTYNVTNTGNVILNNITVTDDKLGEISCPNSSLGPGESMVCTETGNAQLGQQSNIGNVTAEYKDDLCAEIPTSQVDDSDPSHYSGSGYDHRLDVPVPTANPVLLIGVLGIAILLFLRREQK